MDQQNQGILSALIQLIRDQGNKLYESTPPSVTQLLAQSSPPKVPNPQVAGQAPPQGQTAGQNPWGAVAPQGMKPEQAYPGAQNSQLMQLLNSAKGGPATAQPAQNPQQAGQAQPQVPPGFLKFLLSLLLGGQNKPQPPTGNLSGSLQR